MATLVSTGQITIVDNNDAKPITAYIVANSSLQQVYNPGGTTQYVPNWVTTTLVLTAIVYVGSTTYIAASLSNKKWSIDMVTSVGSSHTLTLNTNFLSEAAPNRTYFFEADYTDPVTSLTTHIIAQISLNQVQTGTDAVYILTRGTNAIEEATGTTKNAVAITADLISGSGIDTTGLTYKWYEANTSTQISTSTSGYATKYGFKTTAANATPTASNAELGINVPTTGTGNAHNTIVIGELAVQDIAVFRVDILDSKGVTRSAYFTIYDISDPYDTRINSSTGDKLQNGVGSTTLSPTVYNGSTLVSTLTNWYFYWYIYNKNGIRSAFVDTTKTALAGGRDITANTTGVTATITFSGAAITWAAGNLIKITTPLGEDRIYEISTAGSSNTVTIRNATTNPAYAGQYTTPAVANDLVGGKFFACTAGGIRGTAVTGTSTPGTSGIPSDITVVANAAITVTADDIDTKGRIVCESNRP